MGQKGMGNRKVYGERRREVKEEAEKKGMPSKLVVGSKLCRGPSTPSREGRGSALRSGWHRLEGAKVGDMKVAATGRRRMRLEKLLVGGMMGEVPLTEV